MSTTMVHSPVQQKFLTVQGMINARSAEIAKAIPRGIDDKRLVRIVLTELRKNPKLLDCDAASLMGAIGQVAQLGLEVGGLMGQAYFVPYGKECQLILGYKGLVELARRSGQIKSIEARAVFAGDEFSYSYGMNPTLKHTPMGETDPAKLTHAYAIAHFKDGGFQMEVMLKGQIEKVKGEAIRKAGGRKTPWETHEEEMWRKTPLRKLAKMLPMSPEAHRIIEAEEVLERTGTVVRDEVGPFDDVTGEVVEEKGALDRVVEAAKKG